MASQAAPASAIGTLEGNSKEGGLALSLDSLSVD